MNHAIFVKTGLVNYCGPVYASFGLDLNADYLMEYVKKAFFTNDAIAVKPSKFYFGDAWYVPLAERQEMKNEGPYVISPGEARGILLGGNLVTLRNLQGTPYMPNADGAILFLEDDYESQSHHVDSNLQSLILSGVLDGVKGIVFGRFQKQSNMTSVLLQQIVASKKELRGIPIVADVDFGHTSPLITFPVGGEVYIKATADVCEIIIEKH